MHNPLTKIDAYKADHRRQYPEGTSLIYSNFTARKSRYEGINKIVFFGMQYLLIAFLIEEWNKRFFNRPKEEVLSRYKRRMDNFLGKDAIDIAHIEALHDLGYLPLLIKAVPEGTLVPIKVPCFTIRNTLPEFFWLTNYLETVLSNKIWKPITSATIAFEFRKKFEQMYLMTVDDNVKNSFVMWQGHDFSYRGMSGDEDACTSGAGHLLSFWGTDTIPAIDFLEEYYGANSDEELVGGSVPATEHSVMCMGTKDGEFETFRRLICETYPSGVIAIVSDTWGYWRVVTEFLPHLKSEILSRTGSPIGVNKVVIRPDSGDPYRIIVGYFPEEIVQILGEDDDDSTPYYVIKGTSIRVTEDEIRGSIQCLWNTFGGHVTPNGYRQLDPHIGLIYGDSITLDRQKQILEGLAAKGFASTNVVLGIGSYTYQYQTRDTFGFAMKATYGELIVKCEDNTTAEGSSCNRNNNCKYPNCITESREIFKDPKTDDGTKKSAKGLLAVLDDGDGNIYLKDQCTWEEENEGLLEVVFVDGEITKHQTLFEIRERLNKNL